jgi:hypothetical protein
MRMEKKRAFVVDAKASIGRAWFVNAHHRSVLVFTQFVLASDGDASIISP